MKSLFKRTLAAASGSVLCLTQIAAAAVNVNIAAVTASAAETGSLVIDKGTLLYVPIPEVNPEIATKEGREQPSDWNDKLNATLMVSEAKTATSQGTAAKKQAKTEIMRMIESSNRYGTIFNEDDVKAVLSRIHDGKATINPDGTATATVSLSEIRDIVANIVERSYKERTPSGQIRVGDGNNFDIDWSKFSISGSVTTTAEIDYDAKTITYKTVFTDEAGKTYADDEIENYVLAKIEEGQKLIIDSAAAKGIDTERLEAALKIRADKAIAYDGYLRELVEAGKKISVSGTDLEAVYADYQAAVDAAIESTTVPDRLVDRGEAAIDKRLPATALGILDKDNVNYWSKKFVDFVNDRYGDIVTINLSTADAKAIANEAYDWNIAINGYNAKVDFSIADDQHDALLDAIHASLDATYAAEGKRIVDVVSHKEVNTSAETIYGTSGTLYFDVIRVIDEIITEDIAETTTTTTTTTDSDVTTTTTSSTTDSDVTTTTSSTTDSDVTTTTSSTTDSDVTTTTTSTTDSDVTTTTTSTTDSDVTTTTTSTTDSDVTTTTTSTTDSDVTTTTTSTDVTTTTTTDETTTTTPATYVSFEVNGITDNNLVYWTEETAAFDLSQLSVNLHFVVAGVDQPQVVDVTQYFKADATNPSELTLGEGLGYDYVPVYIRLADEAAIQQIIRDNGFGDELIEQEQLYNGKEIDKLRVHLTIRGDVTLDSQITALDGQNALIYFLESDVMENYADEMIANDNTGFMSTMDAETRAKYFQFIHYAADANDGNGEITALDAQSILTYYLENTVMTTETDWDEIVGTDVVPMDDLHAAPLGRDEWVRYTDGWQLTEAPEEQG